MNDHALRNKILGIVQRMAQYNYLVNNGDNPGYAFVDSPADDPDSGEQDLQQPVRKLQPFGFRGMPPVGSEGVILAIRGSYSQKVLVVCDNFNYGPKDLKDGETAMYSIGKATIKLDKDGTIHIDAPMGQKVIVNGGTLAVARNTDPVKVATTMAAWITAVSNFINGIFPGTVTPPTDFGLINGGAGAFNA